MNLIEVTALGIRLLAIYMLILALGQFPAVSYYLVSGAAQEQDVDASFLLVWGAFLSLLLFSLILIKFPVSFAKLVVPKTSESSPQVNVAGEVYDVGFILLGVYTLSWAIPDVFYNLVKIQQSSVYGVMGFQEKYAYLVVSFVEIAIGLFLILKSSGIKKVILKLRG